MPHEVIMPALGMAQDTGQIVAWLKKPGDPVKAGEALMEVETDKATMEVEAAADGFLTDVRAAVGDDVPVGDVVAMISETADGAGDAPSRGGEAAETEAEAAPAEDAEPSGETPVEGREVIMPALGMSQDSGKIVAWMKKPGDEVGAEDVLFEVETDKAVSEVQAGHDGWLAETRGAEGEDIPVGEVIAIISAEKPEAPRSRSRAEAAGSAAPAARAPKPEPKAEAGPAKKEAAREPEPRTRPSSAPRHEGRILASPKARRLAAERGLDLGRLVEAGRPQPFHVADLEALAALPESGAAAQAATAAAAAARGHVAAEVPAAGLDAFHAWAEALGAPLAPGRAAAGFAAGAFRQAMRTESPVGVALARPGRPAALLADPDLQGFAADLDGEEGGTPDLVLRDLTDCRLTAVSFGPEAVPTLTLTRAADACRLALDYDAAAVDPEAALALMTDLAARFEDPLRHLL